jgi:Family of unknown function (DUF6547)
MSAPLGEYHAFIDGLVRKRNGYLADAVREERFWHCWGAKSPAFVRLLSELTPQQRELLAQMVQHARDVAISDSLAYLREQMAEHGLRLSRNGLALPVEPHHTINSDWWCRCRGEAWPEEEGQVFESGKRD